MTEQPTVKKPEKAERLRLEINRDKSAVGRPWKRSFLSYTVTHDKKPKLAIANKAVVRLRTNLRQIFRHGRGRRLDRVIAEMTPLMRGWIGYFRLSQVRIRLEELDKWLRRQGLLSLLEEHQRLGIS